VGLDEWLHRYGQPDLRRPLDDVAIEAALGDADDGQ